MTTYVYRAGKVVNKETGEPIKVGSAINHTFALPDIAPFKSPLDFKTEISSRSQLREYEKRHGVKQVGTDFDSTYRRMQHKEF